MGKGGIIGKPNEPTANVASGMWSLREQFNSVKNGVWPRLEIITNGLFLFLDAGNIASYSGTGNTWIDLSGNGYNGNLVSNNATTGPTYNSSNNGSIVFDGNDDYVNPGTLGNFGQNIGSGFSVSVWTKTTQATSGAILSTLNTGSSVIFSLNTNRGVGGRDVLNTAGATQIFLRSSINTFLVGYINNSALYDGNWHNLVWTVASSPSTTGSTVYLDGTSQAITFTDTTTLTSFVNFDWPLTIGGSNNRGVIFRFFNGNIAIVKLYTRELSGAEVQQNFNVLRGRFGI